MRGTSGLGMICGFGTPLGAPAALQLGSGPPQLSICIYRLNVNFIYRGTADAPARRSIFRIQKCSAMPTAVKNSINKLAFIAP